MNRPEEPKLKPVEYAFCTPEALGSMAAYRKVCRVAKLTPIQDGWGFMHCVDDSGQRWTIITADLAYHQMLVEANADVRAGLDVPANVYTVRRKGWPDDWISKRY